LVSPKSKKKNEGRKKDRNSCPQKAFKKKKKATFNFITEGKKLFPMVGAGVSGRKRRSMGGPSLKNLGRWTEGLSRQGNPLPLRISCVEKGEGNDLLLV